MWGLTTFVPVFSAFVWLAMLITMLAVWSSEGSPHYSSMDPKQTIAYISDIGAQGLKPLFIAMSTVTVVTFDIAFILERWLRHTGRLTPNTSIWQKIYSGLSIVAAIVGAAGLILLSIFDALRHNRLHNIFLGVFIAGYIVSAIFICWEYQRLGIHFREHSVLRYSFWIKLSFILIEVALAIAFGVTQKTDRYNVAAVLEWVIAFVFFFYVLSFFIDFMPAASSKHHYSNESKMNMATSEPNGDAAHDGARYFRGAAATEAGTANGYTNGNVNGNGMHPGYPAPNANMTKPTEPVPASRNF
ncbi:hypothetical protein BU24DRAFT_492192 [Aaosphaeria arxii CBS 175.79]|uniref:CWH43-like N-terminal domain-containing protein n=1 Tax=Aaosphaeria arxii CBS 175.79 TaxID=1450172 RepID=A0A6A5XRT4_9PLEO|nr:uncharacterized protein BU24DRAFT_492192 [Aaosphaeria arxii CBS 175.79]KAF2016025.1 hypothetical protein BU24DRAFT_492192 [Aaosphaeria arxii CBS 175.79]